MDNTIVIEDWSEHTETGSQYVLQEKEMHDIPTRTAEDVLRQVPGFILIQHGSEGKGHQFYVRGFDAVHGSDLEVTVDGIPINEWSSVHAQGYLDLGMLGNSVLQSVWVSKGSFLPEQGMFATGGSVQYHLSNPLFATNERQRIQLGIGSGNRKEMTLLLSPSTKHPEDFLSVSLTDGDGIGLNRALNRQTLQYKQTLMEQEYLTSKIMVLGNHTDFGLPTPLKYSDTVDGTMGLFDSYQDGLDGLSKRLLIAFQNQITSKDVSITADIYGSIRSLSLQENYTGHLSYSEGDTRLQSEQHITQGSRLIVQQNARIGLLQLGLRQYWGQLQQSKSWTDTTEPLESTAFQQDYQQVWFTIRSMIGNKLRIVPSINWFRINSSSIDFDKNNHFVPRIVNEWAISSKSSLFVSYGYGVRPPNIRNGLLSVTQSTYQDLSVSNLNAATITQNSEVGWKIEQEHWNAQLAGFLTIVPREIIFDHVAGTSIESEGTQREGLEFNTQMHIDDWMFFTSINWVHAHFLNSAEPIPLVPKWNNQLKISKQMGYIHIGSLALFRSPKALGFGATGKSYFRQDVSIQYQPTFAKFGTIQIQLDVENIWNQTNYAGEYWYASRWVDADSTLSSIHVSPDLPRMIRLNFSTQW
jgi:hypothetical protein